MTYLLLESIDAIFVPIPNTDFIQGLIGGFKWLKLK